MRGVWGCLLWLLVSQSPDTRYPKTVQYLDCTDQSRKEYRHQVDGSRMADIPISTDHLCTPVRLKAMRREIKWRNGGLLPLCPLTIFSQRQWILPIT